MYFPTKPKKVMINIPKFDNKRVIKFLKNRNN